MEDEPRAIVFPSPPAVVEAYEPRPLFPPMTTDWIKPVPPEPKPLSFKPAPAPKADDDGPRPLAFRPAAPPTQSLREHAAPRALALDTTPRPVAPPRPPARERVLGGDPRAPALVDKAALADPVVGNDLRMRGRIETFLDLNPNLWGSWAEKDLRVLVDSASRQSEIAQTLSRANATKWAFDCQQAYAKPYTFIDRLTAPKPEFYKERLTQARDILQEAGGKAQQLQADLRPRLDTIRLDALALQVCTDGVTDPTQQMIATRRLQTLVQGQQTGMMILTATDNLGVTIATQAATISDLLTVTIPNWILAQSKA